MWLIAQEAFITSSDYETQEILLS